MGALGSKWAVQPPLHLLVITLLHNGPSQRAFMYLNEI